MKNEKNDAMNEHRRKGYCVVDEEFGIELFIGNCSINQKRIYICTQFTI